MKGIKVSLDTKVNANLINWRAFSNYQKSKDALIVSTSNYVDIRIFIPQPVVGKLYTISFDASGDTENNQLTTHEIGLTPNDIIRFSQGGKKEHDNGHVDWFNLSDKAKRYFVVYRYVKGASPILIRFRKGTTTIRNVKLELSDHPTDYEE